MCDEILFWFSVALSLCRLFLMLIETVAEEGIEVAFVRTGSLRVKGQRLEALFNKNFSENKKVL
jgi:hypothetical protein